MAPQQQRPLKSLNKGPSSKRFVFKNFAQRVEEVDVDVFRSLAPVKFQPTAGSSFFHENLVQWRELNSAADFNDIYQQLLPLVQTLPQLLFYKDTVVECLLSRVHLSAALSLEPILSLVALLSRDLQEEFLLYIPQFFDACVGVLKEGADRDPELLEQIFTSVSYVIKYLTKPLIKDISFILKTTKGLRCYPKSYVQEFAAEAISFLLRNAPTKQLIKGTRRLVSEAEADPDGGKESVAALFWFTLKGHSSGLHSRAESLLRLLLDHSILSGVTKNKPESREIAVQVVEETLGRICEDLHREKLNLLWTCLLEEINGELQRVLQHLDQAGIHSKENRHRIEQETAEAKVSMQENTNGVCVVQHDNSALSEQDWWSHLTNLLYLLNGVLEFRKGSRVPDYEPLFTLATRLLQHFLKEDIEAPAPSVPSKSLIDPPTKLCSEILRLLLGLVKSHGQAAGASFGPAIIAKTAPAWAAAFACQRAECLLPFLQGIIELDHDLVRSFVPHLLRAFDRLKSSYSSKVVPLLLDLCMKMDPMASQPLLLRNLPDTAGLVTFINQVIKLATTRLRSGSGPFEEAEKHEDEWQTVEPAMVWIALQCFPYSVECEGENSMGAWEYALATKDRLASFNKEGMEEVSADVQKLWEALLGAALSAHMKVLRRASIPVALSKCVSTYLGFAMEHQQSAPVLRAVCDLLDGTFGHLNGDGSREYPEELSEAASLKFLKAFEANLGAADKALRLVTLGILSHFEPLPLSGHDPVQGQTKQQKTDDVHPHEESQHKSQVIQQLKAVEEAPLSLENCRQSSLILARIKVDVCAGRTPAAYILLLVHGMIGVLRNRFALLWDAAMDSLAGVVDSHGSIAWDQLLMYLQNFQELFLHQPTRHTIKGHASDDDTAVVHDLQTRLDHQLSSGTESTDTATLLTLLLRTIQKVPKLAEAKSRQLVPLFLVFSGLEDYEEDSENIEVHRGGSGKDWQSVLKEWLILLKEMRNARSLFKGSIVKETLLNRFLMDSDPAIQKLSLECLLNWRDGYLTLYVEHLENLISHSTLREELVTWNVSRDSHQVQAEHREGLLAVVLSILYPKIMKRSTKASGKGAVGGQRNAILSFLSQLETRELAPLFCLLLKPLQTGFTGWDNKALSGSKPAWQVAVEQGTVNSDFIDRVDCKAMAALPYKRKIGFLHMVRDALGIFGHDRLQSYLHALLALVFRCLEGACESQEYNEDVHGLCDEPVLEAARSVDGKEEPGRASGMTFPVVYATLTAEDSSLINICKAGSGVQLSAVESMEVDTAKEEPEVKAFPAEGEDEDKEIHELEDGVPFLKTTSGGNHEIRTLCLKIISIVLTKFEDLDFNSIYWDIFFDAMAPSIQRFAKENHANSTPGSLFACFLAMAKSEELALLLARDQSLVPNVMMVLSLKAASPAMVKATLSFVESLLDLEKEGGDVGMEVMRTVLLPHIYVILSQIHNLLANVREKMTGKRAGFSSRQELRILNRLSQYITDSQEARKLLGVLLPFLKVKKRMDHEACTEVLHIIRGLAPALDAEVVQTCLPVLAPLLASVSVQSVRSAVCQTLQEFVQCDSSLSTVANLVTDLNAMSRMTLEEFDYECRIQAYEHIDNSLFSGLTRPLALLVLSHAVHDMGSTDMSLRHSASSCLQLFVRFASALPSDAGMENMVGAEVESKKETGEETGIVMVDVPGEHVADDALEEVDDMLNLPVREEVQSVKSMVQKFLLPFLRNSVGSELLVVRREWVALLREMTLCFPTVPALNEYSCLLSTDPEVDFFNNIVHLQVHRRIKAMARFRASCASCQFSQGALLRIFVPLFMNSMFEAKGDKEGNLVEAAVETLASIARQLQWDPYFGLLMRSFRFLASKPDHQKVLVRLACAILDAFHFFETSSGQSHGDAMNREMEEEGTKGVLTQHGVSDPKLPDDIQGLLRKRVLPEVNKLMVSNMDIVNASVALTIVKILKLMPEAIIELELPRIVQSITNLLKNRKSQAVRDEARSALVAVAVILGPRYLHYIAGVLKASLTKGFEVHVLGYTLNSLLVKLIPTVKPGEIDYCLEQLLGLLENDIFGEVAEEKTVEAIAGRMKETRHVRSFESVRLISQVITFPSQVPVMLNIVRRNLHQSLTPKGKVKIETMLKHIALGFQSNPSVTQENLFVLVHGLLEDSVNEEAVLSLAVAAKKQAKINSTSNPRSAKVIKNSDESNSVKVPIPNVHLITEFSLQLLFTHLKKVKVSMKDQQALSMLDPLVGLLAQCLNSKYDGVLSGSMKSLCFLVRLPLPSVDTYGCQATTLVFSMSQQFGRSENPLLQACLHLLIALIRHCKTTKISEEQLRLLLQFPIFTDLESSSGSTALSLLKAVVGRKLLVPEIYDMMNRVAELMVKSQMPHVRQVCSQILLQFLLDYPLGPKRLQHHLDFLITNLGYEHASGREAALEMLHTVIMKFPETVVEEQAETLFLPLVTRLVNDSASHVRAMVGTVLKVLMGRVGSRSIQRMLDFSLSWYKGGNSRLWRPAAQVLGFLIEVLGSKFERHIQGVLEATIEILKQSNSYELEEDEDNEDNVVFWQEAYFAMTMVEKLLLQFPRLYFEQELQELWQLICLFLLHPHMWIRKLCSRLLGMYLEACPQPDSEIFKLEVMSRVGDAQLLQPSWLLFIGASLSEQLGSAFIDTALSEQAVKNLVYVGCLLPSLPQLVPGTSQLVGYEDTESQERVGKALVMLGADKQKPKGEAALVVDVNTGADQPFANGHKENTLKGSSPSWALLMVFRRLERIALQVQPVQAKAVLQWFRAMASRLGAEGIDPYLRSMLVPLFKITEGSAAKAVPEELKTMGDDVLNHVREVIGVGKFVHVYNSVRQEVKNLRENRKRAEKIKVLVDPERNAKRKMRMNVKRQAQKRRKISEYKARQGF
ncbi:hypothetical protein CY35_02G105300 [Sphagnum magellanicum]|nr:hypothetical protein CY35_02G105300 [Sphagnum magellanicum]